MTYLSLADLGMNMTTQTIDDPKANHLLEKI